MALSIGIVGLPNVGKSTLFNALTNKKAEAANYPFCTIDPNVGVVKVPDRRLERIAVVSRPARIIPATVEFVDIAGLVKGAHQGEGLGNQFLANIRECQAVCEVVRGFHDDNIIHVDNRVDPAGDRETIGLELIYADLQAVEKRLAKASKDAKSLAKEVLAEKALLEKIKIALDAGRAARTLELNAAEGKMMKNFGLLTAKPVIYVLNIGRPGEAPVSGWDGEIIALNVKLEEEIAALAPDEQAEYARELGLEQSGLDKLIAASYKLLDLKTFFTTGADETRAWTIRSGLKAPQAAGVIHSDFEKNFIRVEVMRWEDFVATGSETAAREKGLLRTEGRDYIVRDGDICHFLLNR